MNKKHLVLAASAAFLSFSSIAQKTAFGELLDDINTVTTAVPFLQIAPDSRAGAMGDVGVATSPDANSVHWNAAKLGFLDRKAGLSISYTPWLSNLVDDINLAYVSYYQPVGRRDQGIAVSLRYFSLGNITFRDEQGTEINQFNPNEFALDFAYGRKLGDNLSGGLALRYIFSNLTGGADAGGYITKPGQSVATDVSLFFDSEEFDLGDYDANITAGLNISNIGAKISYTESGERDFIPTNLRLGTALNIELDSYNKLSVILEANKLLVPTQPRIERDTTTGEDVIVAGKDPNVSVAQGMIQSFSDAPGGAKEEWREVIFGAGLEYWYNDQFAFRTGYFHEHETKGNRKYVTFGAGLKYNVFNIDFAYLVPAAQGVRPPFENTLRFTLIFDLDAFAEQ